MHIDCTAHAIFFGFLVILLIQLTSGAQSKRPEPVIEPVVHHVLRDEGGAPIVLVDFDPRGMRQVHMADEPKLDWVGPGSPDDTAWDYREFHWWKGRPGRADDFRPRLFATVAMDASGLADGYLRIDYQIDGMDCTQQYLLPKIVDPHAPYWDVAITIRNDSAGDVEEYGQFFACYTMPNGDWPDGDSHWYWDHSGKLILWADRGVKHLNGYIAHGEAYFYEEGAVPHCPRGGGRIIGTWQQPVLVSHATAAGWRSVVMIGPAHTAAISQGRTGLAMDYILFPGPKARTFHKGDQFTAHVRHVMIKSPKLPTVERLERLWQAFEDEVEAVDVRAKKLRRK